MEVTLVSDPLCCWSWALEPHWRRVRMQYGARVRWRHRLGGMLPSWDAFADPLNDVAAAAHMGPYWMHVRREAGVPLAAGLWHADPPASSHPASLAVHAAFLQGEAAGERLLRRVREAAMLEALNVARWAVLRELARDVGLDADELERAVQDGTAAARFEDDLREVRYLRVGRFPSVLLGGVGVRRMLVTGFRPASLLAAAVAHALGEEAPALEGVEPMAYLTHWGSATRWELATACALDPLDVVRRLDVAMADGTLEVHERPAAGDVVFRVRAGAA
ncbi:MAG TPA: DsbA family protein [Gemmatimonadales bacterium]|nr:DsbA family protein [Gemmatimonadales bacterium]